MSIIDILVPCLARPQNVAPLLASIKEVTRVDHRVIFIATEGDKEEIEALKRAGADFLVHPEPAGRGNFAKKINWAFPQTDAPWVFQGADDLRFHAGWDVNALRVGKQRRVGVVGTDDMGNPLVRRGGHSTHTLISRAYIEEFGGTHDNSGLVFCELYQHEFCDNEFVQTAIKRGQWAFARRSKVEHLHPAWRKSELDSTYEKAFRYSQEDFQLYKRRMRSGTSAERKARHAAERAALVAARQERRRKRS